MGVWRIRWDGKCRLGGTENDLLDVCFESQMSSPSYGLDGRARKLFVRRPVSAGLLCRLSPRDFGGAAGRSLEGGNKGEGGGEGIHSSPFFFFLVSFLFFFVFWDEERGKGGRQKTGFGQKRGFFSALGLQLCGLLLPNPETPKPHQLRWHQSNFSALRFPLALRLSINKFCFFFAKRIIPSFAHNPIYPVFFFLKKKQTVGALSSGSGTGQTETSARGVERLFFFGAADRPDRAGGVFLYISRAIPLILAQVSENASLLPTAWSSKLRPGTSMSNPREHGGSQERISYFLAERDGAGC